MSDAIFPALPGLAFDVVKTPTFSTAIQTAVSGRELRRANWTHPLITFNLNYEFLRDEAAFNELKALYAFYIQRQGSFDSFLFVDPDDSLAFNQYFGTGDGVTTTFKLQRDYAGVIEQTSNIDVASVFIGKKMWSPDVATPMWSGASNNPMWSNAPDYASGSYTLSKNGTITFNTAPAVGLNLIWNGLYYHRARFTNDTLDFTKFMANVWNSTVDFIATLGDRL